MKKYPVYCVCLPGVEILDLTGPVQVLHRCQSDQAQFQIHYVGPQRSVISEQGLSIGDIKALPLSLPNNAIIILPGVQPVSDDRSMLAYKQCREWLQQVYAQAEKVLCICSGVLIAAECGLLVNQQCTTHHTLLKQLKALEPTAEVLENRIFIESGKLYTCAGILTGIDLALYVVERLAGALAALEVARSIIAYMRRNSDDPQISFWLRYRNHIDVRIHNVQSLIAANPSERWTLARLAAHAGMSTRHLSRVFTQVTGISVKSYIDQIRLDIAMQALSQTKRTIEQVADSSGFVDANDMRRAWRRCRSDTPGEFRAAEGSRLLKLS
ncbi:MAG: helix-turn-helix domain-containing protein [Coxiellaceae bacterium]|nr:helix-turn-helix domain-containing protein [Coxiellaceae bacterium]